MIEKKNANHISNFLLIHDSKLKTPIYLWSVVLWVFVSWAVFRISNTPAAAELTSPCTLGSGNMTGPSGPQLSDCDWSGVTDCITQGSQPRPPWLVYSWNIGDCFVWCDILWYTSSSRELRVRPSISIHTNYVLSRQLRTKIIRERPRSE